ncbi:uncharacterized protein LOC130687060 [Daphnia carinata]|uniref:uncharacterized protein LOC130687060 n=1 Tax=Daphnia carinata TaxID=120202 RepID=UPI00257F7A6E|nr:uncharacterized protein LOC130687060 [Daphnia carinata]
MNSFAWLHVLCSLLCGCNLAGCFPIHQLTDGDGIDGNLHRDKRLFKSPEVSSGITGITSSISSHPWQLMPPMRSSRHHPLYWKASDDEELFLRNKRKPINDQSNDPMSDVETSTVASNKEDYITQLLGGRNLINRPSSWDPNFKGFKNDETSTSQGDTSKLFNKFWNAVYNPLPYGAPRSVQTGDEVDAGYRQMQASGLPVARTASREKERERSELRLPIPDSEIHYRQPVNKLLLQASYNPQNRTKSAVINSRNLTERPVNVEAFRILMEIIKSLRSMDIYSTTTSPSLSMEELKTSTSP